MNGLLEAIMAGGRAGEEPAEPKVNMDIDAALTTLTEFKDNYINRKGRFKVGDVITPRKGTPYRSSGNPHMVCEILDPPLRFENADPSSAKYGQEYDLRILTIYDDTITCFTVESWAFVQWSKELMPDVVV